MTAKMEPVQQRANLKGIVKKILCPEHNLKYLFKCQHPNCESPFICSSVDCIDGHSHQQKIVMKRFRSETLSSKFYEVESMISDDTINENARILKSYIQGLKDSIKDIYVGIKTLNKNYDYLKGDIEGALNNDYIKKVEQNYQLNQIVRKNLDGLKEKVKLEFPLKDSYFSLRSYLIEFLVENIPGFSWSHSREVHSSKNQLTTCEKFHEKLLGLSGLLFIFIGENQIIGSFYSCTYPTLIERSVKDFNSFLFTNTTEDSTKFIKFVPKETADHHLTVSERNYICHGNTPSHGDGIRTFHKNFETVQFSLPSNTYFNEDEIGETISGRLKVKKFLILETNQDKNQLMNGSADELD